jgi:hypothetical protein
MQAPITEKIHDRPGRYAGPRKDGNEHRILL